jgi:uncharacterized protein (AIM24 family)
MDQQMLAQYGQTAPTARMTFHGNKICRVNMQPGSPGVFAKQGSMIAYEGWITFQPVATGRSRRMTGAMTGEGMSLMKAEGQGDLYLADYGADVVILNLNGESLSVNGKNVLAFDEGMTHEIKAVPGVTAKFSGNGMFNMVISGTGSVAITTQGRPLVLNPAERDTFVDPDALVAWTTNLQMKTKSSMRLGGLVGRGTGEAVQVGFKGQGYVVVQPSEDTADRFHARG